MIGFVVCGLSGLAVGFIAGILYKAREKKIAVSEAKPEIASLPEIGQEDIIKLINTNSTSDVTALFLEHKVHAHMPGFYDKYQHIVKQSQELYYQELKTVLSKRRQDILQPLYERCPVLSSQDIILLLLSEMLKDNKTIAHAMGINSEALKKRKTRLKSKLATCGLDFESIVEAGLRLPVPPAGV